MVLEKNNLPTFTIHKLKIALIIHFAQATLIIKIQTSHTSFVNLKSNKSSEFKMTHQTPANRWSLSSHTWCRSQCVFCFPDTHVSFAAHFIIFVTDGQDVWTPCVKIMTTYLAVAWWVNFCLKMANFTIFESVKTNQSRVICDLFLRVSVWVNLLFDFLNTYNNSNVAKL